MEIINPTGTEHDFGSLGLIKLYTAVYIQVYNMVRGGFSELGAPGKYRNGALYICTHLPRSTLRFLFCCDACCCTMVPHSCVQCFYIFHVHVIMGFFHLHLHLHLFI